MRDPNNGVVLKMRDFFGTNISLKSLVVLFFPQLMQWFNLYLFNYDVLVFLNQLTHQLITDRERRLATGLEVRRDVIQLLMEARHETTGARMSKVEIADNLMLFMVAGYDTSSSALCSVVYLLAHHQEVQVRHCWS